jgi:hypothetical protein
MIVVRLKRGLITDPTRQGSRTDYLCARSSRFDMGKHQFWLSSYSYGGKKPTTGICAVFEAMTRLKPAEIFVIGFDRLMHPEREDPPHTWLAHDKHAEHALLKQWGVKELVSGEVR